MINVKYRLDAKTGKPLRLIGDLAVVLNDDGSTVTEHYDANGRITHTSANVAPYPADAAQAICPTTIQQMTARPVTKGQNNG
jgi:hypothetical protein